MGCLSRSAQNGMKYRFCFLVELVAVPQTFVHSSPCYNQVSGKCQSLREQSSRLSFLSLQDWSPHKADRPHLLYPKVSCRDGLPQLFLWEEARCPSHQPELGHHCCGLVRNFGWPAVLWMVSSSRHLRRALFVDDVWYMFDMPGQINVLDGHKQDIYLTVIYEVLEVRACVVLCDNETETCWNIRKAQPFRAVSLAVPLQFRTRNLGRVPSCSSL